MKRFLFALVFFGTAMTALGQGEISISAGADRMSNNDLGTIADSQGGSVGTKVNANFRLGFRFTINNYRFFGHEFGYAYNHGKLVYQTTPEQSVGMSIHQGMYNFLAYATPEGTSIRPFVTGGGHFMTFYPPGSSVYYGNGVTKFGFNYGGGVKVRVSPMFGVRLDLRDYVQGKPFDLPNQSGLLHMLEISGGFGLYF